MSIDIKEEFNKIPVFPKYSVDKMYIEKPTESVEFVATTRVRIKNDKDVWHFVFVASDRIRVELTGKNKEYPLDYISRVATFSVTRDLIEKTYKTQIGLRKVSFYDANCYEDEFQGSEVERLNNIQ